MAKTLKQQVRSIIREHYGDGLSSFRPDVDYQEGTEHFVDMITRLLKGEEKRLIYRGNDLAMYMRESAVERAVSKRLQTVRQKRNITRKSLAEKLGVSDDYLREYEEGRIVAGLNMIERVLDSLQATDNERNYAYEGFNVDEIIETQIRDIIELYYGHNLWQFKPEVSYEESIASFVGALANLIKVYEPPFGYKTVKIAGELKIVPDGSTAPIVHDLFQRKLQEIA